MSTPHGSGDCTMDGAEDPGGNEHVALLRALRSALEVHGPVLGSSGHRHGCGAGASVDPHRQRQGGVVERSSLPDDFKQSGDAAGAAPLVDDANGGNSADATSASSLETDKKQREAAESLCTALRAFLLGWDDQNHVTEPEEMPHPKDKLSCGAITEAVVAKRLCASEVGGQVVSLLFGAFGPTDGQLCSMLLQVLPMLKRNDVRENVLGWLVHTLPSFPSGGAVELVYEVEKSPLPDDNDDGTQESDGRMSGPIAFDTTENVMNVLQTVIKSDPTSLVPFANCLSSMLPSLSDHHANTVSKLCVAGLKVVEAEELPCLIRCLFQSVRFVGEVDDETSHDMGEEDQSNNGKDGMSQHNESGDDGGFDYVSEKCIGAIQAIRAVRTEWALIESEENAADDDTAFDVGVTSSSTGTGAGGISVLVSIVGVLFESLLSTHADSSTSVTTRSSISANWARRGYLSVIRSILDQHDARNTNDEAKTASSGSGLSFSGLDVVAVLALFSPHDSREEVEPIINDLYSMGIFPFDTSATALINSVMTSGGVSLRTKVALRNGLHNLCLCLLLCPLRCRKYSIDASVSTQFLLQVETFVSALFEAFSGDEKSRCELISSLVDLCFVGSTVIKGQESPPSNTVRVPTVKRSERSQRANQFLVQCAHRVEHSSLQVLKYLSGNAKSWGAVIRHRREFVGHLFNSSSAMTTADPALIDIYCGVTVSLFLHQTGGDTNDGEALLALVQRLLFVAPQPDGLCLKSDDFERMDGERLSLQMVGLYLCRRLICSKALSLSQRDTIWSWVIRNMRSQFSPTMGGRPSGEFSPVLGLAGLLVLMEGCGRAPSTSSLNKKTDALQDIPPRHSSDIYGMLKTIVARTGLIQLDAKVSTLIEKSKSEHACYYATVSPLFAPSNDESPKARRMSFSVAGYVDSLFGLNSLGTNALSMDDVKSVPSAATTFQWCFTLLDTYLELGREASGGKWSPDGWLTASFVLCRFPLDEPCNESTGTLTDRSSKVMSALRHTHGCVAAMAMGAAVLKNAHGQYSALCLSGTEDSSAKAKKLLRLIQYQLSVIYDLQRRCMSTLAFIEKSTKSSRGGNARKRGGPRTKKNTSKADHKKRQRGGSDEARKNRKKKKKRKSGGDRLIGNYDASRRVRYLESLNDTEKAGKDDDEAEREQDKMTLPGEEGGHSPDPQDAVSQESSNETDAWLSSQCQSINVFLSDQMSDASFIPQELLCVCLFYEDDGATLEKFVDNLVADDDCADILGEDSSLELLETNALQIIWLRRAISTHLAVLINAGSIEMPSKSILSLLKAIEFLFPTLKILRSNGHRPLVDNGPTSILPVLTSNEALDDVFVDDTRTLLSAYYDILAATVQSDRYEFAQTSGCNESTNEESESNLTAHSLYHELEKQLLCREDGVLACQIIDLVAIIVVKIQDSTIDGSELSWKTLNTVYAGCSTSEVMSPEVSTRLLRRPPAFCRVIQQFTRASGAKKDVASALGFLDRFASTSTRLMKENALLRYSLLNHWALIVTKSCGSPGVDLRKLVQSLRLYVEDVSRDLRASSSSHRARRKSRHPKSNGRALLPEDSATDVDLPNLTAKSFPVFYEGLLYAIAVSFALAKPGVKSEGGASPFKDIQLLSRLFRDMAEMFTESSKLFPQRTMGAVVRACALVVSTCERQVIDCIAWRNKQPFLPSADADADYTSSAFLQTLIDNMAFNCAGSAILFGDLVKSQAKQGRSAPKATKDEPRNGSGEDDDMYFDDTDDDIGVGGEDWAYGSNQKVVANLLLQGEKVIDALRAICTSYNLRPPRVRMTKSEMREVASRDRILSKVKGEEKKETSSSDEKIGPGQEVIQPARALPAFTVRRKGKRKAPAEKTSSTHAGKKGTRRISPDLVKIRLEPKEAEQRPATDTNNIESSEMVADSAKQKPNDTPSPKISKEEYSDSDESFKSKDSFGIDGGWGSSDDDDAGKGPSASDDGGASLSINSLQTSV